MANSPQIGIEFRLPARIRKKGKWFVSSCPSLDVHSQGHTKEQARRNLVDALVFFFESCFERGTLDAVLSEAGFVPATASAGAKGHTGRGEESVTVPLPFTVRQRRPSAHGNAQSAA
jgi:predicted RNase H-like HicB family nuclease